MREAHQKPDCRGLARAVPAPGTRCHRVGRSPSVRLSSAVVAPNRLANANRAERWRCARKRASLGRLVDLGDRRGRPLAVEEADGAGCACATPEFTHGRFSWLAANLAKSTLDLTGAGKVPLDCITPLRSSSQTNQGPHAGAFWPIALTSVSLHWIGTGAKLEGTGKIGSVEVSMLIGTQVCSRVLWTSWQTGKRRNPRVLFRLAPWSCT